MLTKYFVAILTVVLNQFFGLGFADGLEGIVRVAEASFYVRVSCLANLTGQVHSAAHMIKHFSCSHNNAFQHTPGCC